MRLESDEVLIRPTVHLYRKLELLGCFFIQKLRTADYSAIFVAIGGGSVILPLPRGGKERLLPVPQKTCRVWGKLPKSDSFSDEAND